MEDYKLINHLPSLMEECSMVLGEDLRQKDIAEATGLQEATLSRYFNGYISGTKFDIESKLCLFFTQKLGRTITRNDLFSFELEPS